MGKFKKCNLGKWQKECSEGGVCKKCGKHYEKLTVDHIIPLSIVNCIDPTGELAYEDEENFQKICYPCNSFKANKIDITNPKTKTLLKKYTDLIIQH